MQAIPAFADDDTKTKINFDNGASCIISTQSQIYFTEYSYDNIVVPVYMNLQGISSGNMYYSGYIYGSTTAFNFTDSNSNRYVISYFESANENIRTTYFRTNAFYNIFLDNVFLSNDNTTLIGYLHLMGNEQNPTLTLNCSNASQTMNVYAHNLYSTGYEFGFVNAMVYALDNSANLDGMYDILDHIENSSFPEILTTIQTNHTALYNLINSVWLTDQSVLSVSQQTYNTVLSILNILNNIDSNLDDISWKTIDDYNLLYSNSATGELNNPSYPYIDNNSYIKINFNYESANRIYRLVLPLGYSNGTRNIPEFELYRSGISIPSEIYVYPNRYNLSVYIVMPGDSAEYRLKYVNNEYRLYAYNNIIKGYYIDSNDIEYWQILSGLRTGKIADILRNKYTAEVDQVDAIKDEVDANLQNLAQDIVVTKPSQIANIADDYIEQVDTTHNYQVFSWLSAPTFVLMMSIVAGLAVISYMLYGGQ